MRRDFFPIVLLLAVVWTLLTAGSPQAKDGAFTYDSHGRRDPFWPLISSGGTIIIYDGDVDFSDMILEGIIYDPKGERLAIINARVVKVSDDIGGFLVSSITPDHVVLRKDGRDFILKQKKGEIR